MWVVFSNVFVSESEGLSIYIVSYSVFKVEKVR